jgi:hypothetical protein
MAGKLLGVGSKPIRVVAAVLLRGDDRYLVIKLSILIHGNAALAVGEGMAVQLGGFWLASQLAKSLAEKLLVLDAEILVAEEEDATLRDWGHISKARHN